MAPSRALDSRALRVAAHAVVAVAGVTLGLGIRDGVRPPDPADADRTDDPAVDVPPDPACGPEEVGRGVIAAREHARQREDDEIARLERLRSELEGTAPARAPQDPATLEADLLEVAAAQTDFVVELESLDCAAYPCLAIYRIEQLHRPGSPIAPMMDLLETRPGWEHRAFGGLDSPLGGGRALGVLTIWEESEIPEDLENQAQARYWTHLNDARRAAR